MGLYYLQSRYYDPITCRFVNTDAYASTGNTILDHNMYTYCKNAPTNLVDSSGTLALSACAIVIGASGVIGALTGAFSAAATGGNVIEGAIEGLFLGAAGASCGLFLQGFAAVAVGAFCGLSIDVITQSVVQYDATGTIDFNQFDLVRIAKNAGTTGFGTLIPQWGKAADDVIAAIGTAVMWGEASTLIACTDAVATNVVNNSKSTNNTAPKVSTPQATTTAKKSRSAYEKMVAYNRLTVMERRLALF